MGVIKRVLKERVVYWAPGDADKYGRSTLASAVELKARWDEELEEVVAPDGSKFVPKASVMVESDVKVGGVLMYGTLSSVVDFEEPLNNEQAWEIRAFTKNPNFRATEYLRIAHLDGSTI